MSSQAKLRDSLRARFRKITDLEGRSQARERLDLARWLLIMRVLDRAVVESDRTLDLLQKDTPSKMRREALGLACRIQREVREYERVLELARELEVQSELDASGQLEARLARAEAELDLQQLESARETVLNTAPTFEAGEPTSTDLRLRWCEIALSCGLVSEAEAGFERLTTSQGLAAATGLARIAVSRGDAQAALQRLEPWAAVGSLAPASVRKFDAWLAAQHTAARALSFTIPLEAWKWMEALDQGLVARTRFTAGRAAEIRNILMELEEERSQSARGTFVELEAERMSSLETLVAGVAHEINNPNHFIMLNVPYLREAWKDASGVLAEHARANPDFRIASSPFQEASTELSGVIDEIQEGAERIRTIMGELHSYTQSIDASQDGATDLNDAVRRAVRLLAPQLRAATHHLVVVYGTDLPLVGINKRRIEQVLVNLLLNACQSIHSPEERIEVRTWCNGNDVLVEVLDEGCGIPAANQEQVLDPLLTTKREIGGTSMDLAISNRIITMAGGSLEVESEQGQGTGVRLRFSALPADD